MQNFNRATFMGINDHWNRVMCCRSAAQIPKKALAGFREYHPDYLGNIEFITDTDGNPYQFFWYSPWGENLKDQHKYDGQGTNAFNTAFRFNGKEWDEATGLYYYGARYYNPVTSFWLSVDPLADQFPHLTPYNFTENNPVNLIDPTGLSATEPDGGPGNTNDPAGWSFTEHNALEEATVTASKPTWSSESNRYSYGGTLEQWNAEHGDAWRSNPNAMQDWLNQVAMWDQQERDMVNLQKLQFFTGPAKASEDLVYVLPAAPGAGIVGKGLTSPSAFRMVQTLNAAKSGESWVLGAFKSEAKWMGQLSQRGWTASQISEAISSGRSYEAINMVNKGNPAMRYVHPTTGQSVVIDKVTREVIHVGGKGFKY